MYRNDYLENLILELTLIEYKNSGENCAAVDIHSCCNRRRRENEILAEIAVFTDISPDSFLLN